MITPLPPRPMFAALRPAAILALCVVSACASFQSPSADRAPLNLAGNPITVNSVDCGGDGAVVAAGWVDGARGVEGIVLRSADRGATWQRATLDPPAPGVSLSLVRMPGGSGPGTLLVSGYRTGAGLLDGQLASTYPPARWWIAQDDGLAWRGADAPMPLYPTPDPSRRVPAVVVADRSGALVSVHDDPEPGMFGDDRVVLIRSDDGGRHWTRRVLPQLVGDATVVADGRGQLAVAGRTREAGATLWSADAGRTWDEVQLPPPASTGLRVYRNPDGTLFAWDTSGFEWHGMSTHLHRSGDGGRTWSLPTAFRLGQILAMTGSADGRVLALTASGVVLVSDDSGLHWRGSARRVPPRDDIDEATLLASGDGVVVATLDRGRIIRSTDRGESWQQVDSGLPDGRYSLGASCSDARGLVVVAGPEGMLARSLDWGASWSAARMQAAAARP